MESCVFSSGERTVVLRSTLTTGAAFPPGQDSQYPVRIEISYLLNTRKRLIKYLLLLGSLYLI